MIFSGKSEHDLTLRRFARLRFVSLLAIAQIVLLPFLNYDLRAQVFSASGSAVGSEVLVNTTTTGNQLGPQITALVSSIDFE